MNDYYVYGLVNGADRKIFYVGLAKVTKHCPLGYRPTKHISEAKRYAETGTAQPKANLLKLRTIIKIFDSDSSVVTVIFKIGISKQAANELEIKLIKLFGCKYTGSGCLTNLTGGGEGGQNLTIEQIRRGAVKRRGKPSPMKGRKIGPYDPARVEAARQGIIKSNAENPNNPRRSIGQKGRKISEAQREKISNSLKGRTSPMKGKTAWNKGLKTGPMSLESKEKMKGRAAWNKGISSPNKGKTYEDIYGPIKTEELKKTRSMKNKLRSSKNNKPSTNQENGSDTK